MLQLVVDAKICVSKIIHILTDYQCYQCLWYIKYNLQDNCKSDAKIWGITLEPSITLLGVSFLMFILQASLTIITHYCHL
jgi:hypothetical protein